MKLNANYSRNMVSNQSSNPRAQGQHFAETAFSDGLSFGSSENLGLLPKQLALASVPSVAASPAETATPQPPAKPDGFDEKFDSFVRQFKPAGAFVTPDGSKALVRLESFGEASDKTSTLDRPYLNNCSFWVDLKEGRADQAKETSFGGSNSEYKASYEGGARLEVANSGVKLTNADGKSAQLRRLDPTESQKLVDSVSFMPFPKISEPQYLAKLPDNRLFLVTGQKYNFQYDTCKAYVGSPGAMEEVSISSFQRMRDGGTTTIRTSVGTFYRPSSFRREEPTTFNGEPVTRLPTFQGQNADLVASLGVDFGEGQLRTPGV
ncbi:MAG: hypothetical protein U0931_35925 [Vulcanimicrobiota bacterium]